MHTRIVQHAIDINYMEMLTQQHEWRTDYPWFIRRIAGDRVLDLGYRAHAFFTIILLKYGFSVTGVDRAGTGSEVRVAGERFKHVSADVRQVPEPSRSFSTIVAPSLLEHVGIGFYGERRSREADARAQALEEWRRLLRPGGVLLLQVPYGRQPRMVRFRGRPYYQIYTADMVAREFSRFAIDEIAYHAYEPHGWIEVSQSVADHIDHEKPFPPCVAKLVARRTK